MDIDICYDRDPANLERLADALRGSDAALRGAPPGLPFRPTDERLGRGDSFTFTTDCRRSRHPRYASGPPGYEELARTPRTRTRVRPPGPRMLARRPHPDEASCGSAKDLLSLEELGALRDEIDGAESVTLVGDLQPEADMRFRTTIVQDGNNTGIEVPPEIVEALGSGKRPPVKVTLNGYTYRSTVAVMGGASMISLSAANRARGRRCRRAGA